MVKTLHPLGQLSSRIELSPESRIRLEHVVESDQPRTSTTNSSATLVAPAVVSDVASAARSALQVPLNFPPLGQATVHGDRLAIAVDEAIPAALDVVRGAIGTAVDAGVERAEISVVTASSELHASLDAALGESDQEEIHVVLHDPDNANELCLVGQTRKGEWLRVNRTIFEADVVLPIGCARVTDAGGGSVFDSVFPRFCDAATIGRLQTLARRDPTGAWQQADEAGWLLGVALVMQVVPGGNGSACDVVAGTPPAVRDYCQRLCRARWSYHVDRRASLVIATVTGNHIEQRWENVARALAAAERVVQHGGAVAICSDLEEMPGPALARLAGDWDWAKAKRRAAKDDSRDGWILRQLATAIERGPVYFLSQLDDEAVEEMGLAPVADLDELNRLASRHDCCIVLDDAQHVLATVAGET